MSTHPWIARFDPCADSAPSLRLPGADEGRQDARFFAHPGGWLFFDGYLFDREDLSRELGIGASVSAPAVCRHAYLRWGDGFIDRLRGGFVLVVWDDPRHRLLVVRDAMGLHPCYLAMQGGRLLVSSSVDTLLEQPEVERRMHRATVAEFLLVAHPRHQIRDTLFSGIQRLGPGEVLKIEHGRQTIRRYWEPLPGDFEWAGEEEVREIPKKLEKAVERCLAVGAGSLALSGGFDSVSLALLASESRIRRGLDPLVALSLRFPGGPCDEGTTQRSVARHLGMNQRMRTLEESLASGNILSGSLGASGALPSPVLSPWQSVYDGLFALAGESADGGILMGTGGDEMFLVDPAYGADCLRSLRLFSLGRYVRSWVRSSPFGVPLVLREILFRGAAVPAVRAATIAALSRLAPSALTGLRRRRFERRLPTWFSRADDSLIEDLQERNRLPAPVTPARRGGEYVEAMRSLPFRPLLLLELEQAFAWSQRLGTRFLYPYFDRDLVELSLRVHPEQLIAEGCSKAPLRELVRRRMPEVQLPSKKVDFSAMLGGLLRAHAADSWRQLSGSLCLARAGLVDAKRLERAVGEYLAGHSDDWRPTWFGLATETWLRQRKLDW